MNLHANQNPVKGSPNVASTLTFQVAGHGSAETHRLRQARARRHNEYQPTGVYVTAGERLDINVVGLTWNNLYAVIGVPELDTPTTFALAPGANIVTATNSGLLSFINHNSTGHVDVLVSPINARVPTFQLGLNDNADWARQMTEYRTAPVVLLLSTRAVIVVRYRSAELYLSDPETLMQNFELFIHAQDEISGLGEDLEDCRLDPNTLFYLEADRGFMFATHGYMGFNGGSALSALLSTDRSRGWGPWHESGHQRQVEPFTWRLGSGMTEVTVNLYSMAAQETFDGRAGRLDGVYPVTKAYLQQPHRNYNTISDAFHKLPMLWQLRLTFGTSFYPRLHQLYRLMPNKPRQENDKVQRFIVETSLLANVDLTPFFDRWGLYATRQTLIRVEHLPTLTQPLWDTDTETEFPLPLADYIPVLTYLSSNVRMAGVSDASFQFVISRAWLQPYRYEVSINGQTVASVDKGVGENCVLFDEDTTTYVLVPIALGRKDKVEVFVVLESALHALFTSSRHHSALSSRLERLFTDSDHTQLNPTVTQPALDALFTDLQQLAVDPGLFNLFHRAQGLLLAATFRSVSITENAVAVTLPGQAYADYDYKIETHTRVFAELNHGVPVLSTLINGVWRWTGIFDNAAEILLRVVMNDGHVYVLFAGTLAEDLIYRPLRDLFTDDSLTALRPDVVQTSIDPLWATINGDFRLSLHNRARLIETLSTAQQLLLRPTIDRVEESADGLSVYFSSDDFKNFVYVLRKNDVYASDVSQGRPHYSSVAGRHWRTRVNIGSGDHCRVDVIIDTLAYLLYESSETNGSDQGVLNEQTLAVTDCGEAAAG